MSVEHIIENVEGLYHFDGILKNRNQTTVSLSNIVKYIYEQAFCDGITAGREITEARYEIAQRYGVDVSLLR